MRVSVRSDLARIVRPGVLWLDDARNGDRDLALDEAIAATERAVAARPPDESQSVRAMYRRVGIDPTKTRPSSEALLRRVRKGDRLPRVSTLVDICNWCSFEFQLPYGLYDLDAVQGDVELRLGRPGDEYAGIRKDVVHVAGRLTLADDAGPFGNPTSDSARTMVVAGTRRLLVIVFAPFEVERGTVSLALDRTAERYQRFGGATLTARVLD